MNVHAEKIAIVTGAARGIGREIARRLARDGVYVAVNYAHSAGAAEELAREIGGLAVQADIADPLQVRRLFDQTEAAWGRVDFLVNNAGVAKFTPIAELADDEFDEIFRVNARGTFFCLREAARRIRDNGRIVSISTGATLAGGPGRAAYCGSKAAVEQFSKSLAHELGPRGITVNVVSPGFTETDMLRQFPTLVDIAPGMSPLGRVGQPQDVADVVAYLCSDQARWLTGTNIQAGGGVNMV